MNSIIGIIAGIFALLLALLGVQTKRIGTQKGKVKEKEEVINNLQAREAKQAKVSKAADEKKDALVTKAKETAEQKAEAIVEVEALPKEEAHVLSEATKKLASEQVVRTRTRSTAHTDSSRLSGTKKPRATKTDNS